LSQFPPPLNPSELVDDHHPALRRFLQRQVDMQVADLRLLMRLPVPELEPDVGCNLTLAAMLLNLISGFSVWFFETDEAATIRADERTGRPHSKKRFLGFVTTYWPEIGPESNSAQAAERLYEVRNSLIHDLGARNEPEQDEARVVRLAKAPYSLDDIVTGFERNLAYPLTVPVIEEADGALTVHLAGLYWAIFWMLRTAISDEADSIEARISALEFPEFEV
jgi:hypothetical protein